MRFGIGEPRSDSEETEAFVEPLRCRILSVEEDQRTAAMEVLLHEDGANAGRHSLAAKPRFGDDRVELRNTVDGTKRRPTGDHAMQFADRPPRRWMAWINRPNMNAH